MSMFLDEVHARAVDGVLSLKPIRPLVQFRKNELHAFGTLKRA